MTDIIGLPPPGQRRRRSLLARLKDLWYRIKCFLWYRYTTVKPRYLDHQWVDRSALIPHLMFEVLCDFVEKESGFLPHTVTSTTDWGAAPNWAHARSEMLDLYHWWRKNHDEWDLEPEGETIKKQCQRLVNVMGYMWT